jgi:hypothetical protein
MEAEKPNIPQERFKDQNLVLGHFRESILVKCPRCQERAEVKNHPKTYRTVLDCPNCHHHYTTNHRVLDLRLNVYCNQCAHRIHVHIPNVKTKKRAIQIRCSSCGSTEIYQPVYTEYIRLLNTAEATDPFLGLDLWYQASFREHLLWAYNYEHLDYLEQYIRAKLRERNNRKYSTMVEKLPQFIKSG